MKITIILLAVALVASFVSLSACKKRGVQADVDAAVAQEERTGVGCSDELQFGHQWRPDPAARAHR